MLQNMSENLDLKGVIREIASELDIWPISPSNIISVGDDKYFALIRKLFHYAKLTLVCPTNVLPDRNLHFWDSTEWGNNYDVIFCLNVFSEHSHSRSSAFFKMGKKSLADGGRIIAIERVKSGSTEHKEILNASAQAGIKLISLLPMDTDDRWNCLVFQ